MRKKVCVWTLERATDQGWADLEICTIKMGVCCFVEEVFNSIAYISCYPVNYLSVKASITGGNRYILAYWKFSTGQK